MRKNSTESFLVKMPAGLAKHSKENYSLMFQKKATSVTVGAIMNVNFSPIDMPKKDQTSNQVSPAVIMNSKYHAKLGAARRAFAASVASPMGRRYIQFSDGVVQSRLALRVSVCDGHRQIDDRRVRRCNRVTPDQGRVGSKGEWLDSAL